MVRERRDWKKINNRGRSITDKRGKRGRGGLSVVNEGSTRKGDT